MSSAKHGVRSAQQLKRVVNVVNRAQRSSVAERSVAVAWTPVEAAQSRSYHARHNTINAYDPTAGSIPLNPYAPQASTSRLQPHVSPLAFSYDTSKRSFIFQHGASGSAKRGHGDFPGGSSPRPKVEASSSGASGSAEKGHQRSSRASANEDLLSVQIGEDAYFLRNDSLGVADGVGGWTGRADADPAHFSRKIMHHCSSELARYDDVEDELFLDYYDVDPVEVLQTAFERALSEAQDKGIVGSTTALLAVLRRDELRVANLGDCCCSVIRGRDFIFRSEEQQHSFNYPYQVGTNRRDLPRKDAQRFNIPVQKGDIVILSSDGLVDNLFDEDILEEVLRHARYSEAGPNGGSGLNLVRFAPQMVSEALCKRAKAVSEDQHVVTSPFQQRAMDEGMYHTGGKMDDITVLIGVVKEEMDSEDRR